MLQIFMDVNIRIKKEKNKLLSREFEKFHTKRKKRFLFLITDRFISQSIDNARTMNFVDRFDGKARVTQ